MPPITKYPTDFINPELRGQVARPNWRSRPWALCVRLVTVRSPCSDNPSVTFFQQCARFARTLNCSFRRLSANVGPPVLAGLGVWYGDLIASFTWLSKWELCYAMPSDMTAFRMVRNFQLLDVLGFGSTLSFSLGLPIYPPDSIRYPQRPARLTVDRWPFCGMGSLRSRMLLTRQ